MKNRRSIRLLSQTFFRGSMAFVAALSITAFSTAQQGAGRLLQKSADSTAITASSKQSNESILIRLDGLTAGDFVNVRPGGKRLMASAGALSKEVRLYGNTGSEWIGPGKAIDDSALKVNSAGLSFRRTVADNENVFVDIEAPSGSRIRIIADGKTILRAALRSPVAYYNSEWFEGSATLSGTISRAGIALAGHGKSLRHIRDGDFRGVSFSELQLLKKKSPRGLPGQTIMAALQVDETGHVVDVLPVTDLTPEAEHAFRAWQFAPYLVDGHPASFTTVVKFVFR